MITIKKTKKYGRGIFANKNIKKGTIVEISELITIDSTKEDKMVSSTKLKHYLYLYKDTSALALGLGSLFNHSNHPNVSWKMNEKNKTIVFKVNQDIEKGQQLFIDYGYEV